MADTKAYMESNLCEADLRCMEKASAIVESAIWQKNMTTAEKLQSLAAYMKQTLHYATAPNCRDREYNPTFWKYWSVDGGVLSPLDVDGNLGPLADRLFVLQGGARPCFAAFDLEEIAIADLGLTQLRSHEYEWTGGPVADGEGVWMGCGPEESTNPEVSQHATLYYRDAKGKVWAFDTQGAMQGTDEELGIWDKIIDLKTGKPAGETK